MARVVVHVMPKAEILTQGQAIVGALGRLGHFGISDVRQGKRLSWRSTIRLMTPRRDRRITVGQLP